MSSLFGRNFTEFYFLESDLFGLTIDVCENYVSALPRPAGGGSRQQQRTASTAATAQRTSDHQRLVMQSNFGVVRINI
nr:hypothetical protein Iba_scaffold2300CG1230 [Ipomoea batatas]